MHIFSRQRTKLIKNYADGSPETICAAQSPRLTTCIYQVSKSLDENGRKSYPEMKRFTDERMDRRMDGRRGV